MTNIYATVAAMERGSPRSAGSRMKTATACTRVAVAAWWALAGFASAGVGVQAQEAGSVSLAPDEDGLAVSAHIGAHLALVFQAPGVSLGVIVDSNRLPVWGQAQLSAYTLSRMYSVRLGVGSRQGRGYYAIYEKGLGRIHDSVGRLKGGLGFGLRLARDRTTYSVEATLGGHTAGDHGPYAKLDFALHYRLGRFP